MSDVYKYATEMGVKDYFYHEIESIWENEVEAKELVAKKLINVFGYPNNIELHLYQGSSNTEFVNIETNEILASVETINDGTVFSVETNYYGDWFRW